jgi:Ca2+:H+ antiporter
MLTLIWIREMDCSQVKNSMVNWHPANRPPEWGAGGGEEKALKFRWSYIASIVLAAGAIAAWFLDSSGSYAGQLEYWVFGLALLALIPLAQAINNVTETLSPYLGKVARGLIEATFSNIPEIAIGVFLLIKAQESAALLDTNFVIIRGLLIGSVINNTLLVLGSAVTLGALRNGRMKFNAEQAAGFASMLALAVVGLALPTLAAGFAREHSAANEETASLVVSGILLLTYIMYVGASTFGWGEKVRVSRKKASAQSEAQAAQGESAEEEGLDEETRKHIEEDRIEAERNERERAQRRRLRQEKPLALPIGFLTLALLTGIIALMAYFFVGVTDQVIAQTPLTPLSVGLILFPIVCNLGELIAAFRGSWANDMDAAMNVAAGSSVQVPLFVTPALVFVSAILAGAAAGNVLTLVFNPVELIVVGLVTFVYALVNLDGETTWLEGVQLLAFYLMIAVTAFVLPGR